MKCWMLETIPSIAKDCTKKIEALEKLKIVFGGFEPDDVNSYTVDSVLFITAKCWDVQLLSCKVYI